MTARPITTRPGKRTRRLLICGAVIAAIEAGALLYWNHRAAQTSIPVVAEARPQFIPPLEWLTARSSIVEHPADWRGTVPAQGGDEIWAFSSPPATWAVQMGTGGFCLVRGGVIIDGYATCAS